MSFVLATGLRGLKTPPSPLDPMPLFCPTLPAFPWLLLYFAGIAAESMGSVSARSWCQLSKSQLGDSLQLNGESLARARPGFSLQSYLVGKLFSSVFLCPVYILFHPVSCSTAHLRIRLLLHSPSTWWHTWHKSDFLYESLLDKIISPCR